MKIKKIEKKLALNKITVSELANDQLDAAKGGWNTITWCWCGTVGLTCGQVSECICEW